MKTGSNEKTMAIVEGFGEFSREGCVLDGQDFAILGKEDRHYRIRWREKHYQAVIRYFDAQQKIAVINIDGSDYTIKLQEPIDRLINELGFLRSGRHSVKEIRSPMPGMVVDVFASAGQEVEEGDKLFSLEAMKMENIIKSPGQGKISEIYVQKGAAVDKNQLIILFE
jgi:biotin carboxyl carrier protein